MARAVIGRPLVTLARMIVFGLRLEPSGSRALCAATSSVSRGGYKIICLFTVFILEEEGVLALVLLLFSLS